MGTLYFPKSVTFKTMPHSSDNPCYYPVAPLFAGDQGSLTVPAGTTIQVDRTNKVEQFRVLASDVFPKNAILDQPLISGAVYQDDDRYTEARAEASLGRRKVQSTADTHPSTISFSVNQNEVVMWITDQAGRRFISTFSRDVLDALVDQVLQQRANCGAR